MALRVKLFQDLDLTQDFFAIDTHQGGNRYSTFRNPDFKKGTSAYMRYTLSSVNDPSFVRSWDGWGVTAGGWDMGGGGNHHLISQAEGTIDIPTAPAGEYIINA